MFTKLARFVLASWRGKEQSAIDCLSQAKSRLNISPQIGDNHLFIHNGPVGASIGSVGGQGDVHDSIREPKCWGNLVKDERSMGRIEERECSSFFGGRSGLSAMTAPISFGSRTRRRLPLCL
jgi:hypothetical protein